MLETLYFSWDGEPAVVDPLETGFVRTSFMRDGDKDWRKGDGPLVAELLITTERLSKSAFEEKFGIIGDALPTLPTT